MARSWLCALRGSVRHQLLHRSTGDATILLSEHHRVGCGTRVWHQSQVAADVEISAAATLGTSCYIGSSTQIGVNVKIGNYVDLFGAQLEDDVMLSPQAVLTEDRTPRTTRPAGCSSSTGPRHNPTAVPP